MTRQHCHPILFPPNQPALRLSPLARQGADASLLEADIQAFVHSHPEALPIQEVDPAFVNPIAVCRELYTPVGRIDNFLVTAQGFPIVVECKLWRNSEARREVVGQILDYAKELRRWSSPDLQREIRRRLGSGPGTNPLLELVRAVEPSLDEIQFNDTLTANLRRGRFLLLIVGDGIRESVEAIAEYLQDHVGLHFSMGLVEVPVYAMPDGGRLVVPRVLARTVNIVRTVVADPNGYAVEPDARNDEEMPVDPEQSALGDERQQFWRNFLDRLVLDDPEQPRPKPARMGYVNFSMPAPSGSSWLTVYRDMKKNEVGVILSSLRNSAGEYASQVIMEDWEAVKEQLGGTASLWESKEGRTRIGDFLRVGSLNEPEERAKAFQWLGGRVNTFINVLRPRVRAAVSDYISQRSVS